jgi:hypothetical protein
MSYLEDLEELEREERQAPGMRKLLPPSPLEKLLPELDRLRGYKERDGAEILEPPLT